MQGLARQHAYFHCVIVSEPVKITTRLKLSNYPIILHPAYGVFEPADVFIRELAAWRSQRSGSLQDIARIICIWCNYLQDHNISWNEPGEHHYHWWLTEALNTDRIGRNRQARCAGVVMRWSHFLASRSIGGPLLRSFAASISASPLSVEILEPEPRFKAPRGPKLKNGKRPIPDEEEAVRVIRALMNHPNAFIAERNWLLGRTVYETGLRAMGVAALSCDTLNQLLRGDNLIGPSDRVEFLAGDRIAKASIRERIYHLANTGRENLIVGVREKRGKIRNVPFPIPFVIALLQHLWGERARFLRVSGSSSREKLSGGLWLSDRNGNALTITAIKDIVKVRGFEAAGVKGSIHSLRATFLTQYACRLLGEARKKFGYDYDTRGILLTLAEIAGHEDPDTLKHYLDEAQIREALVGEREFLRGV
jgi:integrase